MRSSRDRRKKIGLAALSCLALFGLAFLLSRSTSGGDEGDAIAFAAMLRAHGWDQFLRGGTADWAGHRLFWVMQKLTLDAFLSATLPISLYRNNIVHSALMVVDGVLFMLASVVIAARHFLAKGYNFATVSLAIAALFFASSAVSFFAGSVIECQMCLYVTIIAVILDRRKPLSIAQFILAIGASGFLIFCKSYSLAFLLILALLFAGNFRRIYLAAILSLAAFWFTCISLVGDHSLGGHSQGMVSFYAGMFSAWSFQAILSRFAAFIFSAPYGLVFCFPLLGFAAGAWKAARRELIVKSAAILCMGAFFSLFDYWQGAGAVAGPRYIVPYLFILLPEIVQGFSVLVRRWRWVALTVPLLAILFLPSIDYRNSLMTRWENIPVPAVWPDRDVQLQPGIFAWRIVVAKAAGEQRFRASGYLPDVLAMSAIFPMTSISRALYAIHSGGDAGQRVALTKSWLIRHGLDVPLLWEGLRGLMMAVFLGWLWGAAIMLSRRPRP